MQGNDIKFFYFDKAASSTEEVQSYSILIQEDSFQRSDGFPTNREHLLMALADVDYILIRAITADEGTTETR